METDIKSALDKLLAGISSGHGPIIAAEMGRLDDFLAAGRGQLHPQLIHFLENRSYAKAHLYLGGESDIPFGICGGKHGR
tara:strand:+ start:403 stop:642 length:240 start_codon:yes stop_codon:yes gene_type:complete